MNDIFLCSFKSFSDDVLTFLLLGILLLLPVYMLSASSVPIHSLWTDLIFLTEMLIKMQCIAAPFIPKSIKIPPNLHA